MSEQLPQNNEKEPVSIYDQIEYMVQNARQKAAKRYGLEAVKHDYFRSYENSYGLVADIKQGTIKLKRGKRTYYELVVSTESGIAFDPSEYIATGGEEKFVALKFTILKDRIYIDGRHDFESAAVPLEPKESADPKEDTIGRIINSRWPNFAIYGNYLPPGEELPSELDRWSRKT